MREQIERELKLVPGESFRLSDLGRPLPPRTFDSIYFDTPDFQLVGHGITLRHRVEDGSRLWQLKIPTGAARIELEAPGPPARPPAEMTDLLVVHLRRGSLVKVARLRTRRQTVRRDGAEIVEDAVAVYEAQRVVRRFREVEVELLDGGERTLRRLERELADAGAQPADFRPKLVRALDLELDGRSPDVSVVSTPAEALGAALVEQRRRLIDHDPGTRLGADPEDLHQMRVATRRSRAFLRAARPFVEPTWAEGLRTELQWLGSALGPARDADVLFEHLCAELEALGKRAAPAGGAVQALATRKGLAREAVVSALSDERYFALLDRLEQSDQPPVLEGPVPSLADLWRGELRRTQRVFRALGRKSTDGQLHAARIRVKRVRYAAELASFELGTPGRRFVEATKRLQDVLGEHQDSVVAEGWIVAWAKEHGAAEAAALLVERERKRRKRARRTWPEEWKRVLRRAREVGA